VRQPRRPGEADGDRLAVQVDAVTRGLLDRMPKSVTEIQQRPAALGRGLPFVGLHDGGFHLAATADDGRQVGAGGGGGFLQPGKERGITEQPVFDHLGHARGKFAGRQCLQQFRGNIYRPRMVERTHEVFPGGKVEPCLAANRAVNHGEQSRRHLHILDAPQVSGRGKAAQVAHHAAPDDPEHALPVDFVSRQKIMHAAKNLERLGFLARAHHQARRGAETLRQEFILGSQHPFIRQQHRTPAATCQLDERLLNGCARILGKMNRITSCA